MTSKYKRKGKDQHVRLYNWLLNSAAWQGLSTASRVIYLELKQRYDGFNNGRIGLSCREAATVAKISKDTASRCLKQLQHNGFIDVAELSGFSMKGRVSTEYRLTEYKCDRSNREATKDFMKWRPAKKTTVSPQGQTVSPQGQWTASKGANDV